MNYIRTKDGIYRVLQYGSAKKHYVDISVVGLGHKVIDTSEIIKQADTIEELCDEFVLVNSEHIWNNLIFTILDDLYEEYNKEQYIKWEIYGAIWTNNGLIYVAKMNDKGELELL